jgi:acyl transferase domain-containing protein/aryl carrier-like protein
LANRVSYLFNFNGPSLPVDTACSSSLTAIHLAVQAIRRGECQQAIAGGVNLYLHPSKFSHLSLMQMLSRDGRCRAFGAGADGFVPGEGCGVVLLKPLALARADGDRIHGVIRATAVNHGGRTNGYTVPSPAAQAELVGRALREGGVDPATVSYVEAHGTGTALGDPVEVEGLARAFTGGRPATPWCALGSVKPNIGHLESAAGIAGLTKVLLQFRHRELAPSLHATPPNPRIDFAATPFRVPHRAEPWACPGPRRAGISSFGAGGANAHVIVEEPPAVPPAQPAAAAAPQVIVLSARTRDRLQASAGRLAEFLTAADPRPPLADVAWTLQVGREAREERVAWVATDHAGLLATLRALAADEEPAGVALVRGRVRRERLAAEGADEPGVEVRDPYAAAARWAGGEEIVWAALYATPPRRTGLPGYPFARDRCWLPLPPAVPPAPASDPAGAPVPAAGETTFTIADARLHDHRVQGRPVLPGAVALELLRRPPGGVPAPAGELRRITWARPVAGEAEVTVRCRWRSAAAGWALELLAPAGDLVLVQAQGVAAALPPPAGEPDFAARCPEEVPCAGLYAAFAARGIDYGPAFQVLTRIRRGPAAALAELTLPATWPAGASALPAYVDGALQALAVLGAGNGGLEVPFALDAYAATDGPVPPRAVAEVRRRAGAGDGITRYDVHLRDPAGAWVASLRGVCLRPVAPDAAAETLVLRPAWQPAPPLPPGPGGKALLRGGPPAEEVPGWTVRGVAGSEPDWATLLAVHAPDVVVLRADPAHGELWRETPALVRAALARGAARPRVVLAHHGAPLDLALGGYVRTLRRETPGWALAFVESAAPVPLASLLAEAAAGEDVRLAAAGARERPELVPLAAADPGSGAFRSGGRYLITGGLGGLGRRLTDHLVRAWEARVVLVGRSEPDAAAQAWLAGSGGVVEFVRADLAVPGAAAEVVRAAAAHPAGLDGIVHAAGGLRDGPGAEVTMEELVAALGPKVTAAEGLIAAARTARVPWVALFSSTAGVWGNPGQAAYAFANAALDATAATVPSEGATRVVSIAWPYWAEGGMRATAAGLRLQEQLGLVPLPTAVGCQLLESLVRRGEPRVVVLHARAGRARELLTPPPAPPPPPPSPASIPAARGEGTPPRPASAAGGPPPELLALLRGAAGRVLRLDPAQLEPDVELGDYGFDSVTFTSLANELQRDLGLEVTPAAFFEYRTLQAVADHAWREAAEVLRPRLSPASSAPVPAFAPPSAPAPSAPFVEVVAPTRPPAPADPLAGEPVAVIGMAGVFPGSPDLEAFWRHLAAGADLIGQPASERWPDADRPWGGFIDGIDRFDARAFDISPREAELMDPQQRLFLQAVWHAFEDAGYRREEVAGTRTGLFAGVAAADYASLLAAAGVAVEAYSSTGNAHSVLANRASYHFDLRGPSEAIDTACSSSLVAIHRALESLRGGSCTQAVVGGVNALLSPAGFTAFRRAGMLSPDHRCRSFDARANGYVRGEGVGVIVLKPLSRARRDGDRIHGVILGSAENHGGRVQSLTVPNPVAQAELLVEAWARAGIDPATLGLLEAHGTGTALGDPIEFNGLKRAYAAAVRAGDRARCAIGAVKANLGHLETAAGIAGVLKVLLALRHRVIPGNPQLERLNPYVQPAGTPFHFPTRAEPWLAPVGPDGRHGPRRAGVSSFGFGGANAHVVLEEAPPPAPGIAPRPRLARHEFARDRHWIPAPGPVPPATQPPASSVPAVPGLTSGEARVAFAAAEPVLAHHRVAGQPVLPGAAIAALLLGAGNASGLSALAWLRPLAGGAEGVAARIRRAERAGAAGVVELIGDDGLERARAEVASAPELVAPLDVAALRARFTQLLPAAEALYPAFAARGLDYGPAYRALRRAWTDGVEVWAELELPAGWSGEWQPNPALLDGAFQAVALLPGADDGLALPSRVDALALHGPWPETLVVWVRPAPNGEPGERRYDLTLAAPDGRVVARVSGYTLRAARRTAPLAFLAPVWEPRPAPVAPGPAAGAGCLYFGEDPVVMAGLRAAGWRPRSVRPGLAYQVDGDVTTVRPGSAADHALLLREATPAAILHAWAAAEGGREERGPRAVHALVQALLRAGRESCPLVYVHRGDVALAAGVASYLKAVRLEHPALRARTVVSPVPGAAHLAAAWAPESDWREEHGAWATRILVRRDPPPLETSPRGLVYLITGGRGGIGRRLAAELVQVEGARVVLVGRSAPADDPAPWSGADPADFLHVTADVSTPEGAAAAVAAARARFGRIDGVLHAAGVLRDGAAWNKEWDDFAAVLRPKLAAAEALDAATRDEPLRCFVLFSSVAGLLGAAGQADYALANAALDAFAAARAAAVTAGTRRGHTVAINWPRWRDGGMPVPEGADALGLEPLTAAEGWEIFRRVRAAGEPQLWAFRGEATEVLRRLAPAPVAPSPLPPPLPPAAKGDLLAELAQLFSALSKTPVAQLQPDVSLERHGLDSILAFEFSRRLSERFGEVTPAQIFAQPTLAGLAAFLTARATPPAVVSSAPVAALPPVASAPVPAVGAARVRRQVTLAPADFAFAGPGRLAMEVLYRFDQRLDAAVLRRGLRAVAEDYFPVNASLERRGGDDFVLREARDEPDFAEVVTPGRVPAEDDADGLARFREPFDPTRRGARMARFRLHQLDRGSALVVQVSHAVADGYSFYLFLAAWAAACRGEAHLVPDHSRHLLRTLARRLERRAARQARVAAAIDAFAVPPSDADPTTRRVERLTLDPAALVAAARAAAGGIPVEKLSENSVVTAHLWRHYAAALPAGDEPLVLACPMNFRRGDGVVGPAFFGNASAPVFVRRTRDEVRAAGVPALAAALTEAVRGADERTLAAYHAAMDRVRRAGGPDAVRRLRLADPWGGLVVTNVARFPLPPPDFGPGPAADDVNLVHHAGTAVIVAGPGGTLKARVAYPASTGPASAAP